MVKSIEENDTLQTIASASADGELHGGIAFKSLFLKMSFRFMSTMLTLFHRKTKKKPKAQAIIASQRTTNTVESERIGLNLDDVAKIVNNFDNPTVEGKVRNIMLGKPAGNLIAVELL